MQQERFEDIAIAAPQRNKSSLVGQLDIARDGQHFGRRLQEYRGDKNQIVLDKKYTYAWIKTFNEATAQMSATCQSVFERYEEKVQRFGYSLKHPRRVIPSAFLEPFLLRSQQRSAEAVQE